MQLISFFFWEIISWIRVNSGWIHEQKFLEQFLSGFNQTKPTGLNYSAAKQILKLLAPLLRVVLLRLRLVIEDYFDGIFFFQFLRSSRHNSYNSPVRYRLGFGSSCPLAELAISSSFFAVGIYDIHTYLHSLPSTGILGTNNVTSCQFAL